MCVIPNWWRRSVQITDTLIVVHGEGADKVHGREGSRPIWFMIARVLCIMSIKLDFEIFSFGCRYASVRCNVKWPFKNNRKLLFSDIRLQHPHPSSEFAPKKRHIASSTPSRDGVCDTITTSHSHVHAGFASRVGINSSRTLIANGAVNERGAPLR